MARLCFGGSKWVNCGNFESGPVKIQISFADEGDDEKLEHFRTSLCKADGLGMPLANVLEMMAEERPKDAVSFTRAKLSKVNGGKGSNSLAAPFGDGQGAADATIVDLLDLPNVVARREPSRIIDIGAEETGFYRFWRDKYALLRGVGKKRQVPFIDWYLESWRVNQFCDVIMEEFDLKMNSSSSSAAKGAPTTPTVYAGASDQRLVNAQSDSERTVRFLAAVEKALSDKLKVPARIKFFIPSRMLILKMELKALEWLVARYDGDILTAPISQAFCGILSAHSFSSHLAMSASGSRTQAVQLWTLPIGNGVPLAEGIFTTTKATMEQREEWRNRIRMEMREANFPSGVSGLWIGISAVFHAGRDACPAEVVLSKATAKAKLDAALTTCDPSNVRSLANIILVETLISETFADDAWFLFKREWRVRNSPDTLAATWPLGLYTQQKEVMLEHLRRREVLPRKRLLTPWKSPSTAIFDVPFLAWPTRTCYLLDFGSGETGAYVFQPDLATQISNVTHEAKVPQALFDNFVKPNDVQGFLSTVMKEFDLQVATTAEESSKNPPSVVIIGGLTGLHREMLSTNADARQKILHFTMEAEAVLAKMLKKPVCIRLFVPSGEMEAELELRAVEWLLGVCPLKMDGFTEFLQGWMTDKAYRLIAGERETDFELLSVEESATPLHKRLVDPAVAANRLRQVSVPEDLLAPLLTMSTPFNLADLRSKVETNSGLQAIVQRCAFGGTLSCGGGSTQLTLSSAQRAFLQHFSAAIGSKTPTVQGIFGKKEVLPEERLKWLETVRSSLAPFPSKVTGLFVGISATYHAAKLVGVAERLVTKGEVVEALTKKLEELPSTDVRNISNLTLVKVLVEEVFHEKRACFIFKRNWKVDGSASTYVAGWALGLYSTQFDNDSGTRRRAASVMQHAWRRHRKGVASSQPVRIAEGKPGKAKISQA